MPRFTNRTQELLELVLRALTHTPHTYSLDADAVHFRDRDGDLECLTVAPVVERRQPIPAGGRRGQSERLVASTPDEYRARSSIVPDRQWPGWERDEEAALRVDVAVTLTMESDGQHRLVHGGHAGFRREDVVDVPGHVCSAGMERRTGPTGEHSTDPMSSQRIADHDGHFGEGRA